MNDPIDILEVAARRYANALEWWQATEMMNASEASIIAGVSARASLDVARADLGATEQLIRELAAIDIHNGV